MSCRIRSALLIGGNEIDPLWNPIKSRLTLGCGADSCGRCEVDSWDKADPNLGIICLFNKRYIVFIRSTILDAHPLVLADLVAFSLVNLINHWHLLGRNELYRLEHEVEPVNRLSHVNFLERLHKYVTFCCVRASHR